jgi:hypothetical protein
MIPAETVSGMGGRRVMEEMNSSMIYLIYCKNFCKCHSVPLLSTTILKKKECHF